MTRRIDSDKQDLDDYNDYMASSDEEEGEESEVDMEKMQKYRDLLGLDNSGSEDSDEELDRIIGGSKKLHRTAPDGKDIKITFKTGLDDEIMNDIDQKKTERDESGWDKFNREKKERR